MTPSRPTWLGLATRTTSLATRLALRKFDNLILGRDVVFNGFPIVTMHPGSQIGIGDRVVFTSASRFTALGVNHPIVLRTLTSRATIEIGSDVGISGATICAATQIRIGCGTLIGANAMIIDTDFHPVHDLHRRYAPLPIPMDRHCVNIGANAFLGANSLILKGTTIGDNTVVAAGSVVVGTVPCNSIVAGNPARQIGVVRRGD